MLRLTVFATIALSGLVRAQQAPPEPTPDNGLVIKTETNLVLVDAVVTDKKGAYIADLKAKDFRVTEDGKEQAIKSFSYEADKAAGAPERKQYLVLVFDNGSMSQADQMRARKAAAKFIDDNAGPERMMTVTNFNGVGSMGLDFTADPAKLKDIVNNLQIPLITTMGADGKPSSTTDLAIHSTLENIRSLAKSMGPLPGRKIMVWITAGFLLHDDQLAEATAIISDCNRANVAIYPVDVRGVMTPMPSLRNRLELPPVLAPQSTSVFQTVDFVPRMPFLPQRGGATPSGGGAAPSGGAGASGGGGRSSAAPTTTTSSGSNSVTSRTSSANTSNTGANNANNGGRGATGTPNGAMASPCGGMGASPMGSPLSPTNPCNANRVLVPRIPPSAVGNQQVMFMLASGTGGFVIHDDNDILAGLAKIGQEQNQYYLLGYTPPESKPGACHEIKVKVDRGGAEVRARTGYCSAKPLDVLSATSPVTKGLEAKLTDSKPGKVSGGISAPFFYTSPTVARVNLAMDIATDQLKFEKRKGGDLHSEVNLLGVAYTPQGTVAARFSDTVNLDYMDKEDADAAKRLPLHYENQFDIAPGKYTLKVVYSEGGDNYGRLDTPLDVTVNPADSLGLSGVALSRQYRKVSELGGLLDVAMLEDKTPLIASGLQIVPTGNTSFGKADLAIFYVEMYEPLLLTADPKKPPQLTIRLRVLDRKSGDQKSDSGFLTLDPQPPVGNPKVPMAGKVPVSGLAPGPYKFEFTVTDTANKTATRTADFDVQ